MRYALALVLSLVAVPAFAQDCETLSPNAQGVAHYFGEHEPAPLPPGMQIIVPDVTRRFPVTALTYRIVGTATTQVNTYRRNAVRFLQAILNAGPCGAGVTFTEVAATSPAHLTFRFATSSPQSVFVNGQHQIIQVPVGMALATTISPDLFTHTSAEVVSHPTRSGSASQFLMLHELVGHLFGVLFHTQSSGGQLLGLSVKTLGDSGCIYYTQYTPEQNALNPCWEPAPGFWDVARWIYRHPAGTVIP